MRSLLPLKRWVDPRRPITYGIVQAGDDVPGGVPYIRPVDMTEHAGVLDPTSLLRTSDEIAAQYRRSSVRSGDIVISIGPSFGKTMVVPNELDGANLTQGTARVAPDTWADARYLRWAMQSRQAIAYWESAVGGATFRALNLEPLSRTPVPSWPSDAQRAIADFLDTETARIDALLTKKRLMIGLLSEQLAERVRSRVLLEQRYEDPLQVGRREAEVAGVRAMRLSWLAAFGSGTTPEAGSDLYYGGDIPWVLTGDLPDGDIVETTRSVTDKALADYSALKVHPAGSLIVAMYGATIGKMGILKMRAAVNQACCVIAPGPDLDTDFLYLYMFGFRKELIEHGRGSGQANISQEILRSLRLAVPSAEVQRAIVVELRWARERVERTTRALQAQLDLLQEHRQALITAAVTGELEVPGVAA